MGDDKVKSKMFYAACFFIIVVLSYCFLCFFQTPKLDMTTPLLSFATLLIGYYWGSAKGSADQREEAKFRDKQTLETVKELTEKINKTL